MFQDLDLTLKALMPPQDPSATAFLLLRAADVSFVTPDRNYAVGRDTLDLFLYDVKENRELRDNTPILVKNGAVFTRVPPPLRVDCSYIATAWSNGPGDVKVAAEHQLLAEALQWLGAFPVIPAAALRGQLIDTIYPAALYAAQVDPNKGAGDFWLALGIPPRPAFFLTVTLALPVGTPITAPAVATVTSQARPADVPEPETTQVVGGQVRTAAGAAVAGASVQLLDAAGHPAGETTTDAGGQYLFPRVTDGDYQLRAAAVGFQVGTQSVTVPSAAANYDIVLSPLP